MHDRSRAQEVARVEASVRAEQDQRRYLRVMAARVGRGNFFEAQPRRVSRLVGLAAVQVRSFRTSAHRLLTRRSTVRSTDFGDGGSRESQA